MGRSPCCDKVGLKKGPWTPEEDQKLLAYIEEHGHGSWRVLPTKAGATLPSFPFSIVCHDLLGLQRCGKSCRLRWTNYLRPDIKRGKFSLQEEQTIIQLHALLGNRWSAIATHLPKRTDNEIKNYWNTHLKKRLDKMGIDPVTHKPKSATLGSADGQTKSTANLSHMAQWESARLEAEARLVRESKLRIAALQSQMSGSSTGPGSITTIKPAPPPCLDVLKAWQGMWLAKPANGALTMVGLGSNDDLESPTSTLSFAENVTINAVPLPDQSRTVAAAAVSVDFMDGCKPEEDQEWKGFGKQQQTEEKCNFGLQDMVFSPDGGSWSQESGKTRPTYVDGFTGLLFDNSADDHNSSDGGGDSDNANGDVDEEGKNYWSNILNLVNSSPSNSPMF